MKQALFALFLIAASAGAEQNYARRSFDLPCSELQTAAVTFFEHDGFTLHADSSCGDCFSGETEHLRDARGHHLSTHATLKRYMDTSGDGKDVFGAWYVHRGLDTTAKLVLRPTREYGCAASLRFSYFWYAMEFLVVVPFDGDKASRPSNLRLENEYLQAIADSIAPQTKSKAH